MCESELKDQLIKLFPPHITNSELEEKTKDLWISHICEEFNLKLVEEDPDLKSLKKDLNIKEDPNVIIFEVDIKIPCNTVKLDITI